MKCRFVCTVLFCVSILAALGYPLPVIVVYNATDSAPRGWYAVRHTPVLRNGDYVLAELPAPAAELAAQRHYLPIGVPLLKTIGASFGQSVCVRNNIVSIDKVIAATALQRDGGGRLLPTWQRCKVLEFNELFLLSTRRAESFDSRYFGPVDRHAVRGKAIPLWTGSTP